MCGDAVKHSFNADVFIDLRPVHSLSIADELETCALLSRRFRQTPGPRKRHTQHATVHQVRDDGIGCNLYILNPGLNALHNAHAMPPLWYRGDFRVNSELFSYLLLANSDVSTFQEFPKRRNESLQKAR